MNPKCEIQTATIAGIEIAAAQLICPVCHRLDLNLTVNTTLNPWKAKCTEGHEWEVEVRPS